MLKLTTWSLNFTSLIFVKLTPWNVTSVSAGPKTGSTLSITGGPTSFPHAEMITANKPIKAIF